MNSFLEHNYLCHHGILGMKWGVRRYQNPDGSLTSAGKVRYLKNRNKLNKEARQAYKSIVNTKTNADYQIAKKKSDEAWVKSINYRKDHIKNFITEDDAKKLINPNSQNETIRKIVEKASGKEYNPKRNKYQDAMKNDLEMYVYPLAESVLGTKYKEAELDVERQFYSEGIKKLGKQLERMDGLSSPVQQYGKDAKATKEWNNAANLGLETMRQNGDITFKGPITENDRKWFLFDDQTIGKPEVAAMINRGYSPKEINEVMKTARNLYYGDELGDKVQKPTVLQETLMSCSDSHYGLDEFGEACSKVKASKKR